MRTVFEQAISDIFKTKDFLEKAIIDNCVYDVITTSINDDVVYTEAGLESATNFTLDIQLQKYQRLPKKGEKCIFRNKQFKVSDLVVDSAHASAKIHLVDLSKGV